nr:MAG TPA: hypothetical protein [Caudoviricetes sp.]DAZ27356.1 MAG TPA: hypothetical protein [Caudoviricetes sp.]
MHVMQDLRKKGEGIPSDNPSQKGVDMNAL